MMSTCCSKHVEAWNKYIEKECIRLVNIENYYEMHSQQNIKFCYDISMSPCTRKSSIQLNKWFLAQSASIVYQRISLERFILHVLFFPSMKTVLSLYYIIIENTPHLLHDFELSLWIKTSCAADSSVERRHWSTDRSRWSALSPDSTPARTHARMGDIFCTRIHTHVLKFLENVSATWNVTEK